MIVGSEGRRLNESKAGHATLLFCVFGGVTAFLYRVRRGEEVRSQVAACSRAREYSTDCVGGGRSIVVPMCTSKTGHKGCSGLQEVDCTFTASSFQAVEPSPSV